MRIYCLNHRPFGGNSQLGKGMVFFNTWEEKTHGFSILPEIDFHPRKTNSHFTPDIEMMVGLLTDPFLFEMVPFFPGRHWFLFQLGTPIFFR